MFAQECGRHPTITVYLLTDARGGKYQGPWLDVSARPARPLASAPHHRQAL